MFFSDYCHGVPEYTLAKAVVEQFIQKSHIVLHLGQGLYMHVQCELFTVLYLPDRL